MAEGKGFEPLVRCRITGFQDQLLKPLGHPSGCRLNQPPKYLNKVIGNCQYENDKNFYICSLTKDWSERNFLKQLIARSKTESGAEAAVLCQLNRIGKSVGKIHGVVAVGGNCNASSHIMPCSK